MKLRIFFISLLLLPLGLVQARTSEHYEIFILLGQSNMDGRGKVQDLTNQLAQYQKPQPNVMINYSGGGLHRPLLQSQGIEPLQPGFSSPTAGKTTTLPSINFGPEVSFGAAMAQALPGKKILLIKCSEGGTNISSDWNPNRKGSLYENFITFLQATEKTLKDRGDSYEVRGVLWHQGESDAKNPNYSTLLTNFIQRVRTDLASPNLPFLIGQAYDNGNRKILFDAQDTVAKSVPNTAIVSSKELNTIDNGTHFDAASQIELGKRFAEAMRTQLH